MNFEILISPNKTIYNALELLQKTSSKCLVVVNDRQQLLGTLNDGDIRRSILKKKSLKSKIKKIYKKRCIFISEDEMRKNTYSRIFKKYHLDVIPVVGKNKKLLTIIRNNQTPLIKKKVSKKLEIIIMAGGLGERLKPFTNIIPKPLLPYNGKTIIENVINYFKQQGYVRFIISLNYKDILIKSFFKELNANFKISFLNERKPLGTAGVLSKLSNKNKRYLITNCDTLIDFDIDDLVLFHEKNKFQLTLVVSTKINKIPYGVCQISSNKLTKFIEKPEEHYLANTGIYVAESNVFKNLKKNKKSSMVDLINACLKKKIKIGVYPISDLAWKDFGQSPEFLRNEND